MAASDDVVARLRDVIAADGGLLAEALLPAPGPRPEGDLELSDEVAPQHAVSSADPAAAHEALAARPGAQAAAGPLGQGREDDLELTVELVREGYLLHYAGASRVLSTADPDLALLAGDRCYALGLARLAEVGDTASVAELATVISLSAAAHACADPELADAVWDAGAAAVGFGAGPALQAAQQAARAGERDAGSRLRAAARQLAAEVAP